MLEEIDLNDPTTKALYDSYPEDRKDDFVDAYVYLKYIGVGIGTIKSILMPGVPLADRIEKFKKEANPEILESFEKYADKYKEALAGGAETSFYNAKVVDLDDAIKLVTVDVDVDLEVPTNVIPFKLAREIVLEGNPTIAIGQCGCRAAMPEAGVKCMPEPYEACMFIGDPAASFIADNGDKFRKIDSEEAVRLLEDFHTRGFTHEAYFKTDMNGFYAICNCCSCCCPSVGRTNMVLDGTMPFTNLAASGSVAVIEDDECIGCGACVELCKYHAIKLNEDETCAEIILDRCMGCGVCENPCPTGAITMRAEPSKGGILDLDELRKAT